MLEKFHFNVVIWKISVKESGPPLDLKIHYDAYSARTMLWMKDGLSCQISIDAKRCDTSEYELILKNAKEEVKIPTDVTVLDHPGKPEDPMKVSDVTKESAVVSWKAPLDNGGSNIERYIVEKQDLGRGTCAPAGEVNGDNTSLRVTKLTTGKEYLVRVRAVNKEGEGEPLETSGKTLAKNPYDEPSAPGRYQWVKASPYISVDNNATITDLTDNSEVEFRVKANNKADESEPSSTTGRVKITEYPNGRAPTFVKKLTNTSALLNGKATFTMEFDADPASEVECTKPNKSKSTVILNEGGDSNNNSEISSPPKLTREPEEQRVSLVETSKVKKDDQPSADDDRVRIQEYDDFIIVTIPAPPLPPADDSGSKVTGYVVKRRDTSKGADAWIPVTQAWKETTFTVPSLLDGHEYDFCVMAINENGTSESLRSSVPTAAKLPFKPPVIFNREKPTSDSGDPINGYWIEKREGNTDKWIPVIMLPCQSTHFTVPSLVEDHIYEFRVTAENEAGKGTPSDATTPTKVKDPNASTTPPEFLKKLKDAEGNEDKTITLEYEVIGIPKPDVECTTPDDVDEYNIKARNRGGSRICCCNVNVRCEAIVLKIPYIGSPLPNVMLSKDGNDITKDKNVPIDISNRAVTLTIRNGDKSTTGRQLERITLKHENIYDYYDIVEEIGR
ncbi:unnamed protein product [Adineta steineri]|uniref:Fibronectin type-III domain-containing protein n=1 Tax=Adineta steineri TaxID=433720 RepID=A0A819KQ58_9BILA|nr:unnamed protein product [Adineta steineri]CAF3949867.1 unnamed protein product [Adineta steineri]